MVAVAQPGRASACGADCCGFKSRRPPQIYGTRKTFKHNRT